MTFKTGEWGNQARKRSKHRLNYFKEYYFTKRKKKQKDRYDQFRLKVFNKLGNQCFVCKFNDIRALQIDHLFGGGSKERQKMNSCKFLKQVLLDKKGNYQLLCANCNWIKRYENNENRKRR